MKEEAEQFTSLPIRDSAIINLFDDYVQVWNEKNDCIGDFDWFYLAAAIQSMWNEVILEKAEKKIKPYDRGCITGKSPSGNCVCCGKGGVECCAQCKEKCNGRCGWLDVVPAQQEPEEQIQGQTEIQDYPGDPSGRTCYLRQERAAGNRCDGATGRI